jgi:hypothetical protein
LGYGQTCNLSSSAVCVISDVVPSVGALVMVEVDISRPHTHDHKPPPRLLLQGEGVVFRQRKDAGEFVIMMTHSSFDRRVSRSECGRILTMQL